MKLRSLFKRNGYSGDGGGAAHVVLWFMLGVYPLLVIPTPEFIILSRHAGRFIVLAVLSLFALYLLFRQKRIFRHRFFIPLGLFFIFIVISTVLAEDPLMAFIGNPHRLTGLSTYIFCAVLFLLAAGMDNPAKLLKPLVYCAIAVSAVAVLQYFGIFILPPFERSFTGGHGTMGNPNFLGSYAVFILPAAMVLYLQEKRARWLAASGAVYAGLLVCLTRGTWLAFGAAFAVLCLYVFKKPEVRRGFVNLLLALLLVTALLSPVRDGLIFRTAFGISGEVASAVRLEDEAGSRRMLIWKETARLFPQYWAFGMGPDNLILAEIRTREDADKVADKAHNIYLEIAVTMGVFALASYLAFIRYFLKPGRDGPSFMFFLMIFAYLVQGFFNIDVFLVMPVFWIVLGLSLAQRLREGEPREA